jgi:hypothetical protein
MKKLILSIVTVGLAMGACAQGLVSLSDSSQQVSTNMVSVGGTQGSMLQPAGTYYFELLFVPNTGQGLPTFGTATLGAWTDSTMSGTNQGNGIPTAAYIGHIIGQNAAAGEAVTGWLSGASAYYVVLGWTANEGSWATVQNVLEGNASWLTTGTAGGLFGYSMVGYAVGGTSPAPATILFGTATGLINAGWDLNPVPEPSVLALAGLGGLSLLLMRRRH